ncbi:hypothetical protein ACJX0J_028285, partial [Zea mays]
MTIYIYIILFEDLSEKPQHLKGKQHKQDGMMDPESLKFSIRRVSILVDSYIASISFVMGHHSSSIQKKFIYLPLAFISFVMGHHSSSIQKKFIYIYFLTFRLIWTFWTYFGYNMGLIEAIFVMNMCTVALIATKI